MNNSGDEQDRFDAITWLAPFDVSVWHLIIGTVFFSALVCQLSEVLNPNSDHKKECLNSIEVTWMFTAGFAGQFKFDPQTGPARLFTFSIAFWALLMGAACTANLASFLVARLPGLRVE